MTSKGCYGLPTRKPQLKVKLFSHCLLVQEEAWLLSRETSYGPDSEV